MKRGPPSPGTQRAQLRRDFYGHVQRTTGRPLRRGDVVSINGRIGEFQYLSTSGGTITVYCRPADGEAAQQLPAAIQQGKIRHPVVYAVAEPPALPPSDFPLFPESRSYGRPYY